ncbi:hypothetical protein [Flavobacterium sp.]|uniref:hypothetical protein n=1 Tax=Flavobacterium sp. TaxID=239 RepID=UPI00374DC6B4
MVNSELDSIVETSSCTLEEYKYVYPRLMADFVKQWPDFDEITFLEREKHLHFLLIEAYERGRLRISDFEYRRKFFNSEEDFFNSMSYFEKRIASHKKIRSYLDSKIEDIEKVDVIETFTDECFASNAVQKIIYLNELGIIDLLRKEHCFATSVNNLAKLISTITDEKPTTIQPYLNALLNQTEAHNKNPYGSISTVEKVKMQLANLGFNAE